MNIKKLAARSLPPAAAVFSGLAMLAAFPPFEQGYLAWFALLPLLWAVRQGSAKQAFVVGYLFGLPYHLYLNLYLANVFFPYLPPVLAAATLAGIVLVTSCSNGIFALGVNLVNRLHKAWFTAFAIPALWIISEYLRALSFMAYNVGYIGYSQWGYPGLLGLASVYGYWGLPFMIVFFQVILLLGLSKNRERSSLVVAACAFVVLFIIGLAIPFFQPVTRPAEPLKVALIQGNSAPRQIVEGDKESIIASYLELTGSAVGRDQTISLVVWPETVVDLNFGEERKHHPEIAEMADHLGINLLYGARIRKNSSLFNSITLYEPGQGEIPLYHKHRLVPFVEYFPAEKTLNRLLRLDLLLGSYTAGKDATIFKVGDIPLAGVICFESYFGDHTRRFARTGARHLFIPTNDAWFKDSIGLDQHAQVAAIRAAEMGIGTTQVANGGITISFDYRGRELFRSGKMETDIFIVTLDLAKRETVYSRYGDYFLIAWAFFLLTGTTLRLLRKSSRTKH